MVGNEELTDSTCMKVCQLLFPVTPSGLLERLLNHRVMNVITSNSGHNKNYMHEQAVQLLDFLVTVRSLTAYRLSHFVEYGE